MEYKRFNGAIYVHLLLNDDAVIAKVDDYFGFRHYCYYCYCVKLNRAAVLAVCDDASVLLVAFHALAETMDRRL